MMAMGLSRAQTHKPIIGSECHHWLLKEREMLQEKLERLERYCVRHGRLHYVALSLFSTDNKLKRSPSQKSSPLLYQQSKSAVHWSTNANAEKQQFSRKVRTSLEFLSGVLT
jgi:hypothetical protein